jgi:hypothetical protein
VVVEFPAVRRVSMPDNPARGGRLRHDVVLPIECGRPTSFGERGCGVFTPVRAQQHPSLSGHDRTTAVTGRRCAEIAR